VIVLKATQSKVLAVLQSVAGIVERRHTLPILANVMLRRVGRNLYTTVGFDADSEQELAPRTINVMPAMGRAELVNRLPQCGRGILASGQRSNGFFSSGKANLRNAP